MSDGSLIFDTKIDSSGAGKDIAKLKVKLEKAASSVGKQTNLVTKLEAELKKIQSAQAPTEEYNQLDQLFQKADGKLQGLIDKQDKFLATGGSTSGVAWESLQYDIEKTAAEVRDYQTQMDAMKAGGSAFTKDSAAVTDVSIKLDAAKIKLDELKLKEQEAGAALISATSPAAGAIDTASAAINRFSKRLSNTLKSALIFSVLYKALSVFKKYMSSALKTNDEFSTALGNLKGALLTAFQPIFEAAVPALIVLLNVLTAVITAIAKFFALLSGKSLGTLSKSAEAMNEEANAISGAGGAAENAAKSMANFDEINQLQDNSASGGGGGTDAGVSASFGGVDTAVDKFKLIKDLVLAIAAGLLAWKIASIFTKSLSKIGGLAIAVAGAVLLIKGYWDAWENGVNTTNLLEMFGGLALVAIGLGIAFGGVAAGIALIVGGIAFLVLGFKDMTENGANLQNTLLVIGGILAAGLGIALLTGSWIPLLIAAILAIIVAVVAFAGNMDDLIAGVKQILDGLIQFVTGMFEGDWEKAWGGITNIVDGAKKVISTIMESLKKLFNMAMDALVKKLGLTGTAFEDTINGIKKIFGGIIDFLTGVFTGDWEKAWKGLVDVFKGIVNVMSSVFAGIVNLIIDGLNWLIGQMNKLQFSVPDWVPGLGGKTIGISMPTISHIQIPQLAAGAVIPPNREFLAVLGDQKSGTNIEAPLETILAAFRQVMRENSGGGKGEAVMEVDGQTFGRLVYKYGNKEAKRVGVRLVGV